MLMLALGDSITYGYGATSPERSFVKLLQKQLEAWTNHIAPASEARLDFQATE